MEFLTKNYLQTTTALTLDSNTALAQYLFKRDKRFQYVSDGFNDDATTTSIVIAFDSTVPVSRIGLVGMNWKDFTIFYNGATANVLSLTSTGATTSSDWSSNSETSMFLRCATVSVTQITIDISGTIEADSEKAIGYIYVADTLLEMERVPSADKYSPKFKPKQTVHELSDGNVRVSTVDEKFSASIDYEYVTKTFRNSLYTVWANREDFGFVAFPTTTGWDEVLFPVVWPGNFDFYKFSDNASEAGFSGTITLRETVA